MKATKRNFIIVLLFLMVPLLFFIVNKYPSSDLTGNYFLVPKNTVLNLVWENSLTGSAKKTIIPTMSGNKVYVFIDDNKTEEDKNDANQLVLSTNEAVKQLSKNNIVEFEQEKCSIKDSRFNINFIPPSNP